MNTIEAARKADLIPISAEKVNNNLRNGLRTMGVTPVETSRAISLLQLGAFVTTLLILFESGPYRLVEAGVCMLFWGWAINITLAQIEALKNSQAEVQQNERKLRGVFNDASHFLGLLATDGRILDMNRAALECAGVPPSRVFSKELWNGPWWRFSPECRARVKKAFQKAAQGTSTQLETTFFDGQGNVRHLDLALSPVRSESGEVIYIIPAGMDITERVVAEEELHKFRHAVEQSPSMVIITSPRGDVEYVNPKFTDVTGFLPREVIGRDMRNLGERDTNHEVYDGLWEAVTNGREWRGEVYNRTKSGRLFWERASVSPITNPEGEMTHLVCVKEDVTEERRAAEELKRAKDEADSANRSKSSFLANMSHEIRTPLNAILGYTQVMERDSGLNKEQRTHLQVISRSGEHLLALINDVLEMSKIEAGKITLNVDDFDLLALVDDVVTMFRVRAVQNGLKLNLEMTKDLPRFVRGDQGKIRQVLINLLSNAFKFTKEGSVSVKISASDAGMGFTRLCVEVADTGCGIAADEISKVFDHFEQTASGRKAQQGTGLGLSISRQFVRMMGGEIAVNSKLNEGTSFSFDVLFEVCTEAPIDSSVDLRKVVSLAPTEPPYRLLVVDDKEANRRLLSQLLEPVGFEVCEAPDGAQAVEAFARWYPHLILMDRAMPVMNGLEATRRIKATEGGRVTPIIAVSASVFKSDIDEALEAGCDDFIAKPIREAELFSKIGFLLGAEFVYANDQAFETTDEGTKSSAVKNDEPLLAGVPKEIITAMFEATEQGYISQLAELIDEVEDLKPNAAKVLRQLADNFDYGALGELLQAGG